MDFELINRLSQSDKIKLVDYMEGFPYDLKNYIKGRINEPHMDPVLFHGNKRRLHELSTISRYINRKKVEYIKNPHESCYQSEYCSVLEIIVNPHFKIPNFVRQRLIKILDMDCYDNKTMIQTELAIADLIKEMKQECVRIDVYNRSKLSYTIIPDICNLICTRIMSYKYKSYDFYNYLIYSDDLGLSEFDYSHFYNLYSMINHVMSDDESIVVEHDLAVLLFIYFNDIGITKILEKYNLFDRFEMDMRFVGKTDEFIESVYNQILDLTHKSFKISELGYNLVNNKKILSAINAPKKLDITNQTTDDIKETGGFIFSFKHINSFDPDEIDKLAVKLRGIPRNEINHFINGFDLNRMTFELSENDIGHIRGLYGCQIGTIYDSLNKEIKYIAYYGEQFYILFKDRYNSRKVYGISVDTVFNSGHELERNILTIEESKDYSYEYISEY